MPDYFTDITAQEAIKCPPEDADVLIKALLGPEKAEEIDGDHGLRATHADSLLCLEDDRRSAEIYLFGEDHVDLDQIPQAFLSALGALLCKQGKEYPGIWLCQHLHQALPRQPWRRPVSHRHQRTHH